MPLERCPECNGLGGHVASCQRGAAPLHERQIAPVEEGPTNGDDLLLGAVLVTVGVVITFGSAAAAKEGGNGGLFLFAWGPLVYGTIRFGRGLFRLIFRSQ